MSFLKEIYNVPGFCANQEIVRKANELGLNLSIGDNYRWLTEDDFESLREEGILVNEDLISFLEKQNVEFSDILKEDFHNMREGEELEIYLKDESGLYSSNIFLEYLDIDGVQNFEVWLDFNNLYKESDENTDINNVSSEGAIRY